jgi:LacI family transcriptional regulator
MRKESPTLKKIAQELNVSISTVSKALNDSKEISAKTKERIKEFAKHLHYKPNRLALSLKNQQSKTLGVIIPEVVHYFFATVINGIETVASDRGYTLMIAISNESNDRESAILETFYNNYVDGFILSLSKKSLESNEFGHIQSLIDQGLPVVLFDRVSDKINCDKVIVNDRRGAQEAVSHLIERGRREIILISTPDYVSVGKLRTEGYIDALTNAGIKINKDNIIRVIESTNSETNLAYLKMKLKHILQTKKIDAIFAVNEIYGAEAMEVLKSHNLSIPEDVAIICFTDGLISRYSTPALSTVNQHGEEIGIIAANMLIDRIENKNKHLHHFTSVISCTVVHRASS